MAYRASMTAIGAFVESLVNDTANAYHSEDQIQAACDRHRVELRYMPMEPIPTRSGTTTTYVTFQVDGPPPYLETDATTVSGAYASLTPATSDYTGGRFTYSSEPARPVYVTGWSHDPYAAAADLLEARAAAMAGAYDFTSGPDSYSRSQMFANWRDMAARYRQLSPRAGGIQVVTLERSDVAV